MTRSLAFSIALHVVAILAVLSLDFASRETNAPVRVRHISLVAPQFAPPALRHPYTARPQPVIPIVPRPTPRQFHAPAPTPSRIETWAAILLPAPAVEPVHTQLPQLSQIALPKPQPKTDNLAELRVILEPPVSAHMLSPKRAVFDEAASIPTPPVHAPRTGISFDDATALAATPHHRAKPDIPPTAVEILFKPHPAYTAEARQLHIQGEVLLDVLFTASGDVRVLRLVRGLGHGLDEAAAEAARQIRFHPATRAREPVDAAAIVHIVFQIAN